VSRRISGSQSDKPEPDSIESSAKKSKPQRFQNVQTLAATPFPRRVNVHRNTAGPSPPAPCRYNMADNSVCCFVLLTRR